MNENSIVHILKKFHTRSPNFLQKLVRYAPKGKRNFDREKSEEKEEKDALAEYQNAKRKKEELLAQIKKANDVAKAKESALRKAELTEKLMQARLMKCSDGAMRHGNVSIENGGNAIIPSKL